VNIESVVAKCKALKLKAIADNLQQTTVLAEQKNWSSVKTIEPTHKLICGAIKLQKCNIIASEFWLNLHESSTHG